MERIVDAKNIDILAVVERIPEVIPRLYLSIMAVRCLLSIHEKPPKKWLTCLVDDSNGLLTDLASNLNAIRQPFKGLYILSFACQLIQCSNQQATASFLTSLFGQMHTLWVRLTFDGPLSEVEQRSENRKTLIDHVVLPLKHLSQLSIPASTYKESICPEILHHVICSQDHLSQTIIFTAILDTFPIDWHRETIELLLGAVNCFIFQVDLRETLNNLVGRILADREETFEHFDVLWTKLSLILQVSLCSVSANLVFRES